MYSKAGKQHFVPPVQSLKPTIVSSKVLIEFFLGFLQWLDIFFKICSVCPIFHRISPQPLVLSFGRNAVQVNQKTTRVNLGFTENSSY